MTSRHEIDQVREQMREAVTVGFPSFLDRREAAIAERKRAEAACRDRFLAIQRREVAAGLRTWAGHREPFAPGAHVLMNYPPREGVVITYAESKRHAGDPPAGWSIVRYADGSEGAHLDECMVSLDLEGEASR